jgi:hypothetical protein
VLVLRVEIGWVIVAHRFEIKCAADTYAHLAASSSKDGYP